MGFSDRGSHLKAMALAMKAMKAIKAMKKAAPTKAMKAMKAKKAMKVSNIAKGKLARVVVFKGGKAKTASGMTKDKLTKSKSGKIVSKAASARAKKAWVSSPLKKWVDACKQARKVLGVKGFVAVGGKTAQGKALYAKVKSILAK